MLLLAALAGFVYFYEIRGADERYRARVRAGRLLPLKADAVTGLTICRGDTTIVIEKRGDRWRILQPVATGGDDGEINGLIRTLQNVDLERVVADSVRIARGQAGLSDFGLDRPNLVLAIRQVDRVDSLFWGDRSPTGRYGYIRWSGHPGVLAVAAPFRMRLEKGLLQLRDRRVAEFNQETARRIEIAEGDARVVVEKRSEAWRLTYPVNDRTDSDEVQKLIKRLHTAEFTRVIAEEPGEAGDYGLESPTLTVSIFDGGVERRQTIKIGRRMGSSRFPPFFASFSARPMVFLIDSTLVADLRKTASDLRFKRIFAFDAAGADRLKLAYRDRTVECVRDQHGDGWHVLQPKLHVVLEHRVRHLFRTIQLLEAEVFVAETQATPEDFGFDRPALEVTVWRSGAVVQKLSVGERDGNVYARGSQRPQVVRIDPGFLTKLKLELIPVKPDVVQPDTIRLGSPLEKSIRATAGSYDRDTALPACAKRRAAGRRSFPESSDSHRSCASSSATMTRPRPRSDFSGGLPGVLEVRDRKWPAS